MYLWGLQGFTESSDLLGWYIPRCALHSRALECSSLESICKDTHLAKIFGHQCLVLQNGVV